MTKIKVKLREHKVIETETEIEIPFYYKHKLYMDGYSHHIYGKIDGINDTTIQEKIYDNIGKPTSYELETEKWDKHGSYMTEDHKSYKQEYDKAKKRLSDFFSCI